MIDFIMVAFVMTCYIVKKEDEPKLNKVSCFLIYSALVKIKLVYLAYLNEKIDGIYHGEE